MKKIFAVIAIMAMFAFSFSAFAMTPVADSDLSTVTGQAGVSINLDVRVDLTADVLAWGDADGIAGANTENAGWVGLTGLEVSNLRIRADQILLEGQYFKEHDGVALSTAATEAVTGVATAYQTYLNAGGAAIAGFVPTDPATWSLGLPTLVGLGFITNPDYLTWTTAVGAWAASGLAVYATSAATMAAEIAAGDFTPFAPLTIDVATGTGTTNGEHGNGITFVRIGLGSLQIAMESMVADVELGPDSATVGTPEMKYTLGSLYLGDLALRIGGNSYVDIFNARGADTQGVSIYANATIKGFHIGTLAWGDADGIDWAFSKTESIAEGDVVPIDKLSTQDGDLETPDAIAIGDNYAAAGPTPGAGWVGLKNLNIAKLTAVGQIDIDVATDASDWTFVQINLGSSVTPFAIGLSGMTATAALGANAESTAGLDQELGELYVSGVDVEVYGALQIGARDDDTQGVTINLSQLNVTINQGLTVSWGDLDGLDAAGDTAGYVGLSALNIVNLGLTGYVTIDVATVDESLTLATSTTLKEMMYAGYVENNLSPTFVHIGLGTGDASSNANALHVTIGSLSAGVTFANNAALAATGTTGLVANVARTIGSLYIGTLDVGINGWVDIAAH